MTTADGRLFDVPIPTTTATRCGQLTVSRCEPALAVSLNEAWHSRLPHAQAGPWRAAYVATDRDGNRAAAALWHNPSARGLPQTWLELRRYAISPTAPRNTGSWMLARMAEIIRQEFPDVDQLISYQDTDAHTGTIYKAANWTPTAHTAPRQRDRTPLRTGTRRRYRTDANGPEPASAGKIRWHYPIT